MRDKFTFHRHWMDDGDEMTEQERHEYLDAIVRYGLYGKRKAMSQYVRGRMVTVMREMDEDARREEAFREKQRRNGMLGGRPKNPTKPNETQRNPKKPWVMSLIIRNRASPRVGRRTLMVYLLHYVP